MTRRPAQGDTHKDMKPQGEGTAHVPLPAASCTAPHIPAATQEQPARTHKPDRTHRPVRKNS